MVYTLKGKVKRFIETTLIGNRKMALDIIAELMIADDNNLQSNKSFSHRNISYSIDLIHNGAGVEYTLWRNSNKVLRFAMVDGELITNIQKRDKERLYRTWKELV